MALVLLLALVGATRVTPIEKVVTMLKDLQTQVESDGDAEAATYDTFACFCKDKTEEKTGSISEGETAVEGLQADLDSYSAARATLDSEIDELNTDIQTYQTEHDEASAMRKSETKTFELAYHDMTTAIAALERAIATLKASDSGSEGMAEKLLQVKPILGEALLTAKALNFAVSDKMVALLSEEPSDAFGGDDSANNPFGDDFAQPASGGYEFKSGDIIGTLEGLHGTFKEKLSTLESDDAAAQAAFDQAKEAKVGQITATQTSLGEKEKERGTKTEDIAIAQADLTEKNAVLNDDRVYLQGVAANCETKAKSWNQRTTLRAGELAAITQALTVIEGQVAAQAAKTGEGGRSEAESATEEKLVQIAFVQTHAVRKHQPKLHQSAAEKAMRAKLVQFLTKAGKQLKNPTLSTLAVRASSDPFAKVKVMVQELIERLLAQEADEASHKGWCDTEMGKVIKDRDYRLRDLAAYHTTVEELNARMETLTMNEHTLTTDIAHLESDLANQTTIRDEESAENGQTVADSKEGVTAVQEALDILSHFYGAAANEAKAALFQQDPSFENEAPDSGFDGAYGGNQGASTGVLGLLDVIKSDFERSISETEAAEAQAKKDFVEYSRETEVSIATKKTAVSAVSSELDNVRTKLSDADSSVRSEQELLDTAVKTWEELIPQCVVDPGMSAEERAQAREQEISALKEAYCVLNDEEAGCSGVFLQKRARLY